MIIEIDNNIITPRIQTMIRQLVDHIDDSNKDATIKTTDDGVSITLCRTDVKYIIVARSFYKAHQYIFKKEYKVDDCAVVIASIDGYFTAPNYPNAVVENADDYVT